MKKVIFEPWGLGDAVIAASAVRENPSELILSCNPKWHSLIQGASTTLPKIISTQSPYTERGGDKSLMQFLKQIIPSSDHSINEVLSVRGDFRDLMTIFYTYPRIKIRMNGWSSFIARQIPMLNWFFSSGLFKVENRYDRWEKLCGLPKGVIAQTYQTLRDQRSLPTQGEKIAIHLGAQWKSRQYPFVQELKKTLQSQGFSVQLIAGPNDTLPRGITEDEVMRPIGNELISELNTANWAITNDSGPMHLAAFMGLRTITVALISNITEWLPPGAIAVSSKKMPKGYKPLPEYVSDIECSGWPEPKEIIAKLIQFR
jgi:hypothetical protein